MRVNILERPLEAYIPEVDALPKTHEETIVYPPTTCIVLCEQAIHSIVSGNLTSLVGPAWFAHRSTAFGEQKQRNG